jgi:hypothetical protein
VKTPFDLSTKPKRLMKNAKLIKLSAICAILGSITTLVLVLIPAPEATTFDEKVMLYQNPQYMGKLWIFFFHPQLNLVALLGVVVLLYKTKPELVLPGFLFVAIWAITEAAQQAFSIDAVNLYWRTGYVKETDEIVRTAYRNNLIGSEAIRDSMYFLLLYAYGIGSTLIGLALLKETSIARISALGFLFFGALSLIAFAGYYGGLVIVNSTVNFSFDWIYPVVQPISRCLLGVWLWKSAHVGQAA